MTKSYNNNKLTVVSVEVGLVCHTFATSGNVSHCWHIPMRYVHFSHFLE